MSVLDEATVEVQDGGADLGAAAARGSAGPAPPRPSGSLTGHRQCGRGPEADRTPHAGKAPALCRFRVPFQAEAGIALVGAVLRPESAGHEPMTEIRTLTRTASSPHGGVAPIWTGVPRGSGEPLEGANAAPH
jgi:hypothetical protein